MNSRGWPEARAEPPDKHPKTSHRPRGAAELHEGTQRIGRSPLPPLVCSGAEVGWGMAYSGGSAVAPPPACMLHNSTFSDFI